MNRKPSLKSLSEGRGNCPLPSRTHPQKLNLAVYTEELTHLITASNPFPALPSDFTGPYLAMRFRFYYNSDQKDHQ